MSDRMDWYDFIAENNSKYGTTDEDWEPLRDSAIVTFDYDTRNNVSGKWKGMTVYRDGYYENTILPGETWICTLTLNPRSGSNYFAKPVQKVDASFLYELKKDQLDELSEVLWERNRAILEPILEERYRDEVRVQLDRVTEDIRQTYETRVAGHEQTIAELEATSAENERIIRSLQDKVEALTAENGALRTRAPSPVQGQTPAPAPAQSLTEIPVPRSVVMRTGPDTLESPAFTKSRYMVHLSADHKLMAVRPDDRGNVVCMNNTIQLLGLSFVSPFSEEYEMTSEYNSRYGAILIHLK